MNANMPFSSLPRTPNLPAKTGVSPSCLSSRDILGSHKAIEINHNGSTYKLQATRLGKLILTK